LLGHGKAAETWCSGCHALDSRARPARLATGPSEQVCRPARLGSADPRVWVAHLRAWAADQGDVPRVCRSPRWVQTRMPGSV